MKKLVLFLVCFAFCNSILQAQHFFRTSIPNFGFPRSLIMTNDSGWVVGESIVRSADYLNGHARLSLLDKFGKLKTTANLNFDSTDVGHISRLLTDSSGNIYALGNFLIHCDVISDNVNIVYKFNKNLKLIWERKLFFNQGSPGFDHGGFAFDSKNNLLVTNGGNIHIMDPSNGNDIKMDSISNNFLSDVFVLKNDDRFFSGREILVKTDKSNHILWSKKLNNNFIKSLGNNLFAAVNRDSIVLLDSAANIINTYIWSSSMVNLFDIASNGYHIFCSGRKTGSDSGSVLLQFDLSLNFQTRSIIPRITMPYCIQSNLKYIAIAGTDLGDDLMLRTEIVVMDTSKTTEPLTEDIGVIKTIPLKHSSYSNTGYGELYELDLDIVVKNFGNTTIQSFSAYTNGSTGSMCTYSDPEINVTNQNLAPGDTVRLHLGTFYKQQYTVKPEVIFNVCAYTSSPNNMVDKNTHNDYRCDTFTYTGIETTDINKSGMELYPNPTSSIVHLSSAENLKEISVYNSTGQLKLLLPFTGQEKDIDVSLLPPGIYFLKATSENNSGNIKFIKI